MSKPKINHGYFNTFYAFKLFESDGSIEQYKSIMKKLQKSGILISSETIEKEINFMEYFSELILDRKRTYRNLKEEERPIPRYLSNSISKNLDKPQVTITPTKNNIEMVFQDDLLDELEFSQQESLAQLVAMYSAEEQYTGLWTKDYKNKFVLFPPQLTIADKTFHPSIFLTIFKHGYAIVHFSMEIEDMTYDYINDYGWNIEFDKVYLPDILINDNKSYIMKRNSRVLNINSLLSEYGKYIDKLINAESYKQIGQYFYHLVLTDFAYNPEDFSRETTKKFNENFFKLLYSPIQDHQLRNETETRKFIESKFYSFSNYHRLYANYNRTISIFTKKFKNIIKPMFEDNEYLDNPYILNSSAQKSSLGAMINSIEFLLLKKDAAQQFSVFDIQENTSLKKLIDILIKENINYSVEFSKYFYVYGSVRELMDFLEEKCEDYLQTKLMNERREKIEKVISLKKEREIANFTALGPILTVAITLVFSFPALESIMKSFNKSEYLNTTYIFANMLFALVILFLFRTQLKETGQDILSKVWPRFINQWKKFVFRYYCTYSNFLEFINLPYKKAFRQCYLVFKSKFIKKKNRDD